MTHQMHITQYSQQHGIVIVSGNQAPLNNQWLDLGTYQFNAGDLDRVAFLT
jgi:hypothetical protein